MKRKNGLFIVALFLLSGMLIMSCEKNIPVEEEAKLSALDIELAADDAVADDIYDDIDATVDQKLLELDENNYQLLETKSTADEYVCLVITVDYPDSTRFPKVVTFDYGEGCSVVFNGDTITKMGKIIVTMTDRFNVPGSQHILTFEDFFVNEVKVEGTRTITYNGLNDDSLFEFSIVLEGGKLTFIDPSTGEPLVYTREAGLLKEWYRAPVPVEDSLYLNGLIWGVNVYGENYSREITEELTLAHCLGYGRRWVIVDGQILSIVGETETLIDYEGGGCDAVAQIRRDGAMHRIRIHERHRNRVGSK